MFILLLDLGSFMVISKKLFINTVISFIFAYFVFHCFYGNRGIISYLKLHKSLVEVQLELKELTSNRIDLEHKVVMLRPESLDKDLLDEKARYVLGLALPKESVFIVQK